jgi:Predicted rRNA methylase
MSLIQAACARLSASYHDPEDAHQQKIQNSHQRLAYLATRLPATYAVCEQVFQHLAYFDYSFATMLDLGCGPGTASLCAKYLFAEVQQFTLLDQDREFEQFARQNLAPLPAQFKACNLNLEPKFPPHDLVVMSYALNEMTEDTFTAVIHKAWQATKTAFVVIEPGTPRAFGRLRQVREQLIQYGAKILAPCTHEKICPLAAEDWCHFSVRLPRSPLHKYVKNVALMHEDEKYSYLIAVKEQAFAEQDRAKHRIIKRPLKRSGHTLFDLCNENGVQRLTISKRNKDLYKQSLKLEWGDDLMIDPVFEPAIFVKQSSDHD